MKIAIFVNTPAQVHFHKNIVYKLLEDGNEIYLLARDYGETLNVLEELGIDYFIYSRPVSSKFRKILALPSDILRAYLYLRERNVNLVTGFGIIETYSSLLLGVPSIIFNDSEPSVNTKSYALQFKLFMPFASVIITPASFRVNLGDKHIKINSYKEMAYLHPNYFQPNSDIFNYLGIDHNEEYILLRFNAFDAVHDLSISGFSNLDKIFLVSELEKYAHVFISSEACLSKGLEKYAIKIPKSRIHDTIYYAKLLVTDTQTMATEGAILGTPTIRCNKFVGTNDMGNFIELENTYNLIFNYKEINLASNKLRELIQTPGLKEIWREKKQKLFTDKIDLTMFMVWFIEKYPISLNEIKRNPEIQKKFKIKKICNYSAPLGRSCDSGFEK